MMCRVNPEKLHDSVGDVKLGGISGALGKVPASVRTVRPFVGFVLDNDFGNEYCFYSNGPGQMKTRHRGVAVDPSGKKK